MTKREMAQDLELLNEIEHIANNYGVESVNIYPSSQLAEIIYQKIGQGCVLSNLIEDMMNDKAPKRSWRVIYHPSERKMTVELR